MYIVTNTDVVGGGTGTTYTVSYKTKESTVWFPLETFVGSGIQVSGTLSAPNVDLSDIDDIGYVTEGDVPLLDDLSYRIEIDNDNVSGLTEVEMWLTPSAENVSVPSPLASSSGDGALASGDFDKLQSFDPAFGGTEGDVIIGENAGGAGTGGTDSVIIGGGAGDAITSGSGYGNVIIGRGAATAAENPNDNVLIGPWTAQSLVDGYDNVVLGENSGQGIVDTGSNTVIGNYSGFSGNTTTNGEGNTIIGQGIRINPMLDQNVVIGDGYGNWAIWDDTINVKFRSALQYKEVTTIQRNALLDTANTTVYDTDLNTVFTNDGTMWNAHW